MSLPTTTTRGYLRLNRDERGGSLRELADALDEELSSGTRRVVLDNTYLTRAARNDVIEAARRHGAPVRCIWLDTPLAQAQVNLVERLLDRFGALPTPGELRSWRSWSRDCWRRPLRCARSASSSRRRRTRASPTWSTCRSCVHVVAGANRCLRRRRARCGRARLEQGDRDAPHLVYDWNPDGSSAALDEAVARLAAEVSGPVEGALCPHAAGPPTCWCRPPLPGLPLAFARAHGVDPSRSMLVGNGPAHRTLATALGARYVPV